MSRCGIVHLMASALIVICRSGADENASSVSHQTTKALAVPSCVPPIGPGECSIDIESPAELLLESLGGLVLTHHTDAGPTYAYVSFPGDKWKGRSSDMHQVSRVPHLGQVIFALQSDDLHEYIKALREAKSLRSVVIVSGTVDKRVFAALQDMEHLEDLWITGQLADERDLRYITSLWKLKRVVLHRQRVSRHAVKGLEKRMPDTKIVLWEPGLQSYLGLLSQKWLFGW